MGRVAALCPSVDGREAATFLAPVKELLEVAAGCWICEVSESRPR